MDDVTESKQCKLHYLFDEIFSLYYSQETDWLSRLRYQMIKEEYKTERILCSLKEIDDAYQDLKNKQFMNSKIE